MLHAYRSPQHLGTVQVVHGKHRAALILVADERKTLRLTRVFGAHQIDVHDLAVLREDGEDVALGEIEGEPASEDVRRVFKLGVPRRALAQSLAHLAQGRFLRILDLCKGFISSLPTRDPSPQ